LLIEPGTKINLNKGVSLIIKGSIIAKGRKNEEIIFSSSSSEPFGSIIITNTKNKKNIFSNVHILKGSDAIFNGIHFLGTLSVYYSNIIIENTLFKDNTAGDALNIVYSKDSIIRNNIFINNSDCIDFDFSSGEINNNYFKNCKDDGIDVSHSDTSILNNIILNSGDKGISVGEKSIPNITNNTIKGCNIGIAIKDLSKPILQDNVVSDNVFGIKLYVKKKEFGSPSMNIKNNAIYSNNENIYHEI